MESLGLDISYHGGSSYPHEKHTEGGGAMHPIMGSAAVRGGQAGRQAGRQAGGS